MVSVQQLCWNDIDFARRTIRWRAEADKKRQEWGDPIPALESLLDELRQFQRRLDVVGADINQFRMDLRRAELKAGLSKLKGSLSPEVSDLAQASFAQKCRGSRELEGRRTSVDVLPATG